MNSQRILLIIFLLNVFKAYSQPPPPPPGLDIVSGLPLLIILGIYLGIKKLKK